MLKALLHIKSLFSSHDQLYILDRIYITDYCIWLQSACDEKIKSLASEANHYCPTKDELGFGLEKLESMIDEDFEEMTHEP